MNNEISTEYISPDTNAKVVVLFGGSPQKRDEVIRQLIQLKSVTVIGTLSEQAGIDKLIELEKVDLVLIGGRYTGEQRIRIRSFVKNNLPNTTITEPGIDYSYRSDLILRAIKGILRIKY